MKEGVLLVIEMTLFLMMEWQWLRYASISGEQTSVTGGFVEKRGLGGQIEVFANSKAFVK